MEPATIRRRRWATDTDTIWEKISHSTAKYSKTHTHTRDTQHPFRPLYVDVIASPLAKTRRYTKH